MVKINTKNKRFTKIEINLSNLSSNIKFLKSLLVNPKTKIMAVVKSNAYGHGLVDISKQAAKSGVSALGVALAEDAIKLRKSGITLPIYILGEPPLEIVKDALKYNFILCLNSYQKAKLVSNICERFGKKLSVHLKIDTGMNRVGINYRDAVKEILMIDELKGLKIEGIFTHFSCASEPDPSYTLMQWERFQKILNEIQIRPVSNKNGKKNENSKTNDNKQISNSLFNNIKNPIIHCANSAAFFRFKEFQCDMVRLGISIYGLSPFSWDASTWLDDEIVANLNKLKPILTLKSKISFVKYVPKGEAISYGATFITKRPSIIATIPIGYADGYSRLFSNKAFVMINGDLAPVVGNVTMDQIMVDVTDVKNSSNIKEGTEVILISNQSTCNTKNSADIYNNAVSVSSKSKIANKNAAEIADKSNIANKNVSIIAERKDIAANSEISGKIYNNNNNVASNNKTNNISSSIAGNNNITSKNIIVNADYLANLIGTINYEILCMLKDRIPRIYVY